ncbi:MAG: hypothetical protein ABIQ16_03635 [Polyangiaceae bacterium]
MMRACLVATTLSLLVGSGCSLTTGSVKVEPVAISSQKPGNVALFVAVSQHGSGVIGLQKQDFKVFENGIALENDQIGLTLLPTTESASSHATLIVDMSKSLKPSERKSLSDALRPFIVRLRQREAVSLYAFDGAEKVHLVQEYSRDARTEPDQKDTSMDRLLSFSRKDASTSLYSAVLDGAKKLDLSLAAEGRPIQNGTLIVIALNPDSAGRVEESKLRDFIDDSPHHYFLMTVGTAASAANLSFIGKNGETRAGSAMTMGAPLNDVANAIDDDYFRNYLVAYCSPARAGTRDVRLQVTTRDAQGKESKGSYSTQIDATGFGPGCTSEAAPHFVMAKPKEPDKERKAVASSGKPAPKVAGAATATDDNEKLSSAKPGDPAPIAEPPSGLGYE